MKLFDVFPVYINFGKRFVCIFNPFTLKKVYLTFEEFDQLLEEYKAGKGKLLEKIKAEGFDPETVRELIRKYQYKYRSRKHNFIISYIIPTDVCNFRCKYCYFEGNLVFLRGKMTEKDIERVVNFISKAADQLKGEKYRVTFYGGEPLLAFDVIKEIVERLKDKNVRFTIITNGSLVNEEFAKFVKANDITVSVSIDGDYFANKLRVDSEGKETFYKAIKAIAILKDYNVKVAASVTVSSINVHRLPDIVKFLAGLGIRNIGFNILLRAPGVEKYTPNPKVLAFFMFKAFKVARKIGVWENRTMRRLIPFLEEKFKFIDCPLLGFQSVDFAKDAISPCQGFISSNIFVFKDFKEFEESLKSFRNIGTILDEKCLKCPAIGICGGTCPYHVYLKYGKFGVRDEDYFCQYVRKTLEYFLEFYYDEFVADYVIGELSWEHFKEFVAFLKEIKETSPYFSLENPEESAISFLEQNEFGKGKVILMRKGGKIIGFANYAFIGKDSLEIGIAIRKEYRGQGYGKKLLEELIRRVPRGHYKCYARIHKSNISSQRLFEKFGFKRVGEKENYVIYLLGCK